MIFYAVPVRCGRHLQKEKTRTGKARAFGSAALLADSPDEGEEEARVDREDAGEVRLQP